MLAILGYLGYGNYGDEILSNLVIEKIKSKYGNDTEVQKLSKKNSLQEHFKVLKSAKKIYAIGGMFQDLSGPFSCLYYCTVLIAAHLLNTEIIILGQGIGPIKSPVNKILTYIVLKLAKQVSIRDQLSHELLEDLEIKHSIGTDMAWLYADEIIDIKETKIEKLVKNKQDLFVLNLRNSHKIDDEFIAGLKKLIKENNYKVLSLAMQEEDFEVNKLVCKGLKDVIKLNANKLAPQELIFLMKKHCKAIYSMRLHALIMARIAGIQINAVDCDPKIHELTKQLNKYDLDQFINESQEHLTKI